MDMHGNLTSSENIPIFSEKFENRFFLNEFMCQIRITICPLNKKK